MNDILMNLANLEKYLKFHILLKSMTLLLCNKEKNSNTLDECNTLSAKKKRIPYFL